MDDSRRDNPTEKTHLLISSKAVAINAPSITDSGLDATSTGPARSEKKDVVKDAPSWRRWLSISVLYFTMVTVTMTYSIVVSSLFPYLQALTNNHASTTLLGWVVAGYSLGQLVMSPVFGFWSDRRPTKEPIIISLIICMVANVAYCYAEALPSGGQYMVLVSRAFVGASAGSAAVVRSYVAAATTEGERNAALAGVSGFQTLGFMIGPLLALGFVPLKNDGVSISAIRFHFNMYTGPGFLSVLLAFVNIILIVVAFKDYKINLEKKGRLVMKGMRNFDASKSATVAVSIPQDQEDQSISVFPTHQPRDWIAVVVIIILFFITLLMLAVSETITVPYSMDEFAWDRQQAVLYNNIIFGVLSVISIITFIVIGIIGKWVEERVQMMFGLFILAFSFFVFIPMSDQLPPLTISLVGGNDNSTPYVFHNNSAQLELFNATIPVGCRYPQLKWCIYVPQLTLGQYIASLSLLAVGYNTAVVSCFTIYSKALGPFPQGTMMGLITAVGSFARTVGPLFVTFVYDQTGPQITFAIADGLIALAIVLLMVFCYRLVPYGKNREL